jgi:hypothetical protein
MFKLSLIFYDSMWSFWVEVYLCRFFIICLCMYCSWRSSHFLYLSQTRTWPSNVICHGLLCSASSVKMRDDCSFCWYWWNWWLSLFKLSFHKLVYHLVASAEISQFVIKRCIFFCVYYLSWPFGMGDMVIQTLYLFTERAVVVVVVW